jgi:hypothetical protein
VKYATSVNPSVWEFANATATKTEQQKIDTMLAVRDEEWVHRKASLEPFFRTPKITFDELVSEMVREDLKSAERDELVKKHGYKAMDYHE